MDIKEKQAQAKRELESNIHTLISNFAEKKTHNKKDYKILEEGINTLVNVYVNTKVNNIYQEVSNELHQICQ